MVSNTAERGWLEEVSLALGVMYVAVGKARDCTSQILLM